MIFLQSFTATVSYYTELSDSQISNIMKGLKTLSNLKYVNVSNNKISKEAVKDIASLITGNTSLQHVSISNCGIGEFKAQVSICKALSSISSLLFLDVSNNYFENSCAEYISSVLNSDVNLKHINFSNCFTENLFANSYIPSHLKSIKNLSLENNI